MTKEKVESILKFYRTIPDEIKLYREKRKDLEDAYNPLCSPCMDGMPHNPGVSDQTANRALNMEGFEADQIKEINGYIISLESLATAIFTELKMLPYYEKMVVYRFYLDGWGWVKVAFALQYGERQCIRFRDSALEKLLVMFDANTIISKYPYPN